MRITKRTNLAIRVLMFCSVNTDRLVTKNDIAKVCNSSENHLGQIVNKLSQSGLLQAMRGRGGGIRLGMKPVDISIGEVFRRFEGGVPVAECFADVDNTCPLSAACRLREALSVALEAFYSHLDTLTLADLIEGNTELEDILCLNVDLKCANVA